MTFKDIDIDVERDGTMYSFSPSLEENIEVVDAQDKFRELTAQTPKDKEAEDAFIASKINLLKSIPGLDEDMVLAETEKLLPAGAVADRGAPVPGGVGYGPFYNTAYKTDFSTGSRISVDYIAPTKPGGNVNTWLYLTTTNRTAKGVEAFISYNAQKEAHFKVFDWARDDHWQIDIPFSKLSDYLTTKNIHGKNYQVITIQNTTQTYDGKNWQNWVWLTNYKTKKFDVVYNYTYDSTEAIQKKGWVGSWGPIVETFQDKYSKTKTLGASLTYILTRDKKYKWDDWKLLSKTNSYIRNDKKGFELIFLDPNYSYAVSS